MTQALEWLNDNLSAEAENIKEQQMASCGLGYTCRGGFFRAWCCSPTRNCPTPQVLEKIVNPIVQNVYRYTHTGAYDDDEMREEL